MRFGKALAAVAAIVFSIGQADAVTVFGSLTTDSAGNASLALPLASAHWDGRTRMAFYTPFAVTSQIIGTSVETVTFMPSGPLLGVYYHEMRTPLQTTAAYKATYYAPAAWQWYRKQGHQYSIFSDLLATLNINSTPNTTVDYRMSYVGVPEPSTWAMMILGFGAVGTAVRKQRKRGSSGVLSI